MVIFATPCLQGTLLQRRQRFLADVLLDSGQTVEAHCPNTGALKGLCTPGTRVAVSEVIGAPKARCRFVWQMAQEEGVWVGVNTQNPNRLVKAYLQANLVAWGYDTLIPEKRVGHDHRIDFFLSGPGKKNWLIEVKNAHWKRGESVFFPDSITQRGTRHIQVLQRLALGVQDEKYPETLGSLAGCRATLMYVIQRSDLHHFSLAQDIDPRYAAAVREATEVTSTAYGCSVSPEQIVLKGPLPSLSALIEL